MGEEKKLFEAIEQLAILTIMAEPDDMIALGSVLEKLEAVEKIECAENLKAVGALSGALKKLVEKIILKEIPDLANGILLLRDGVRILQRYVSSTASPHPDKDEEKFWEKMEPLVELKMAFPTPPGKIASQSPQSSSDITQDMELYTDFVGEALEHLAIIELNIINLEQAPEDQECINAIFRPFHTIKGVSGFLNLKQINKFAHAMESLLDDARNKKLQIHRGTIDFILEAVDFLKKMIVDLKTHLESGQVIQSDFNMESYLSKITLLQMGEPDKNQQEADAGNPETVRPLLGEILASKGIVSQIDVQEALKKQATDKTGAKIGEILVKESKAKTKQVIEALRDQKRISAQMADSAVKVDTQKLDNLIDMVGELVIAQSLVQQNPAFSSIHDQKLNRDFSHMKRITTDLQRTSMFLRMVPIRQTFQKMIRLVRDLARKSDKQVDLVMSGEETEIDRNMVDTLYDPLVHMIRNSIDHGIEPSAKRVEVGKPESGRIFLRAFQKGGYIIIEIEDDGQGLNRPKIAQKAKERGLIPPEASLSEYQIDNLIFEPGFSTADQVTDVSGRGVGMDVVKKTIEKLKGKVEIFSSNGQGCRFVMRVPLTLAIMDGIVVRIGEERFIIPMVFIKETLKPHPADLATVQNKGELIKVRDTLLPLVRLHDLLGVVPHQKEAWEALVVVVENDGCQKGLIVDDLIGKQEVVIKNLGETFKTIKGVAGATIMGDGRVGLILDIHGIFELDQNT